MFVRLTFYLMLPFFLFFSLLEAGKPSCNVLVDIPPFSQFVQILVGAWVDTHVLFSSNVCPHHRDWKPSQILQLKKADVLVCFESDSLKKYFSSLWKNSSIKILEIGRYIAPIVTDGKHVNKQKYSSHGGEDIHDHKDVHPDLHMWFSVKNVMIIIDQLSHAFQDLLPLHSKEIADNAYQYSQKLFELDRRIKRAFEDKQMKNLYAGHSAWHYFAKDYDLDPYVIDLHGQSPSLYDLKNLSRILKKEPMKIMFTSPHPNNVFLKNFLNDMGGRLVVVDTLSSDFLLTLKKIATIIEGLKVVNR